MLSVVIPTHADPLGLYLTVFSLKTQLEKLLSAWEILIVADGGTDSKYEITDSRIRCLRLTGNNRTGSPQGTRDYGIRHAKYKNVLCIESHVIISDVEKLLVSHLTLGSALTFPVRLGEGPEMLPVYGHTMDWGKFWYQSSLSKSIDDKPYKAATFGHACFMVDRDWYKQAGGYTMLQQGWGGEEPYLNLLAWQTGREVWMTPSVHHYHYLTPGAHSGNREDFNRNFQIAAYLHGGVKYLDQTTRCLSAPLLKITTGIEQQRQEICKGLFSGDLDALREYFKRERVLN